MSRPGGKPKVSLAAEIQGGYHATGLSFLMTGGKHDTGFLDGEVTAHLIAGWRAAGTYPTNSFRSEPFISGPFTKPGLTLRAAAANAACRFRWGWGPCNRRGHKKQRG